MILSQIVWDFAPEVFPNTFIPVRWYGLLFALGFVFAYLIMQRVFKREGLPAKHLDDLTLYVGIGTIVGARLGHCLFYEPAIYLADPIRILYIWEGGLASHGAALGILLAIWVFARNKKYPFAEMLDKLALVIPVSGAMIRFGNLANSEIYGKVTTLPWGFEFRRSYEIAHRFESHHPTQIYEALAYLLIAFVLWKIYDTRQKNASGYLFGLFLILLFAIRFLIEFVKEPQVAFEQGMALNMGQLLSVPFVVAGIVIMILRRRVGTIRQTEVDDATQQKKESRT